VLRSAFFYSVINKIIEPSLTIYQHASVDGSSQCLHLKAVTIHAGRRGCNLYNRGATYLSDAGNDFFGESLNREKII